MRYLLASLLVFAPSAAFACAMPHTSAKDLQALMADIDKAQAAQPAAPIGQPTQQPAAQPAAAQQPAAQPTNTIPEVSAPPAAVAPTPAS